MINVTPFPPGLSPVHGKAVVARFDGGRLSSEGGLLALREIESRLGLANRLAACLKDPRAPERVVHRLAEIIRFRLLMNGRARRANAIATGIQPSYPLLTSNAHLVTARSGEF